MRTGLARAQSRQSCRPHHPRGDDDLLGFAVLTFLPLFTQTVLKEGAETCSHLLALFRRRLRRRRAHRRLAGQVSRMADCLSSRRYGLLIRWVRGLARAVGERALLFLTGMALMVVFDGDLAHPADRAERNARPDEHLHGRVPRRDAAREPGQRPSPRWSSARSGIAVNGCCWSSSPYFLIRNHGIRKLTNLRLMISDYDLSAP